MIEIDWGNFDETILIWAFHKNWTANDFIDAIGTSTALIHQRTTQGTVHILLDIQHTQHLPSNMFAIGRKAIQRSMQSNHRGLIVVINQSELWNRLYDVLEQMIPNTLNICFAKDADEAYKLIREAQSLGV